MGKLYRNTGAPIPRKTGFIPTGAVFEATEWEVVHLAYKVKPVLDTDPPQAVFTLPEPGEPKPEWPLRMSPARYLELHPEGLHAEMARQLLGASDAEHADER